MTFVVVAVFFMLNLVVATTYNQYRARHKTALMKSRELERKALHCAFATLDIFDSGFISVSILEKLLRRLRRRLEPYQILSFFELLKQGSRADGMLDEGQFLKVI
jgi:Ca2+-binding EF-hand superfamily protein